MGRLHNCEHFEDLLFSSSIYPPCRQVVFLLSLLAAAHCAPLIFAAKILKTSTIARAVYGLLGIQPENFFTTERTLFDTNIFDI